MHISYDNYIICFNLARGDRIKWMIKKQIESYKSFRPFTDGEAWVLFKAAAIGEAIGWSLLIFGILFERYFAPGNDFSIPLTGSIHGTLFLIYIAATVVLGPSQGWNLKKIILAGIASVPPYGTLVFEQWAAHRRRSEGLKKAIALISYRRLLAS